MAGRWRHGQPRNGGGATCAQQLDALSLGLDAASVGLGLAGTITEAVGAVFVVSETPGIIIQAVGTGLHIGQTVVTGVQNSLPNCNAEFTGTVETWANVAAGQGVSAFDGAIMLGTPTQGYLRASRSAAARWPARGRGRPGLHG